VFFGHNLPTTNVRMPIKDSKNADFHLVYFKRKSKESTPRTFFSGPDDVIRKSLYPHPLMTLPPKKVQTRKFPDF